MASVIPNAFLVSLGKSEIDWVNDTIKAALVTSSYTPNIDTDEFWSDVSANEFSGGSYSAGGVTLTTTAVTKDNTNDRGVFDCDDIQFTGITGTFRYIVIYQSTGVASTSRLIRVIDPEGADVTLSNGTYDLAIPAGGVLSTQSS